MKTAEKFLLDIVVDNNNSFDLNDYRITSDVTKAMIEFAKLHVKAALKEASEKAVIKRILYEDEIVDKQSILNAYPESNIK